MPTVLPSTFVSQQKPPVSDLNEPRRLEDLNALAELFELDRPDSRVAIRGPRSRDWKSYPGLDRFGRVTRASSVRERRVQ